MYKIVTLKKVDLFGFWKAVRIIELPLYRGLLCWKGFRKMFPEFMDILDKGKEIKMILLSKGDN